MKKITIIDYGVGNLLSVVRAFEYHGIDILLTSTPNDIKQSDYLVLPGVGAFSDGMHGLQERDLIDPIKEYCKKQRPFMGICLGMQMMFSLSEEFGYTKGLDIVAGKVIPVPTSGTDGVPHKIPHVGWNEIVSSQEVSWEKTVLANIPQNSCFYFVHSFMAEPEDKRGRLADCFYDGQSISAVIQKDNLFGCQFHPEKSGVLGLQIIKNFSEL